MILYALTHGFLDSIPVDEILRFEQEFFDFLDQEKPEILAEITETKDLPDSEKLDAAIVAFKEIFLPMGVTSSSTDEKMNLKQNKGGGDKWQPL